MNNQNDNNNKSIRHSNKNKLKITILHKITKSDNRRNYPSSNSELTSLER